MKVVHITPVFPPKGGGLGIYVYYLCKELRKRGHENIILFRGEKYRKYIFDGLEVIEIKVPFWPPLNTFLFKRQIETTLQGLKFDLIHIHHGALPPVKRDKPLLVTAHTCAKQGIISVNRPIRNKESIYRNLMLPIYAWIEKWLISSCNRLTVVSPSLGDEFRKHYGIQSNVIFNAVDPDIFRPSKTIIKEKAILYTGRIGLGKGLMDIVNVGARLKRSHPNVKIFLIGNGPEKKRIERRLKIDCLNQIKIISHLSHQELIKFYQKSIVYIHPSVYEGLPTSILEAMACELPVVATNVSGIPEEVDNGITGYMFQPGDIQGFYDRIVELLEDKDKQKSFGKAGRKKVLANFTWERVAQLVEKQYSEIL
jgi:glycosyltransferase involved in cell wall biosynthesis